MPNVKDTPTNIVKCLIACVCLDLLYIIPMIY